MISSRVTITRRNPGPAHGFMTVFAHVADGDTGEYVIAEGLAGTQREIDEILAQSAVRRQLREATKAGMD